MQRLLALDLGTNTLSLLQHPCLLNDQYLVRDRSAIVEGLLFGIRNVTELDFGLISFQNDQQQPNNFQTT